MNETANQDQVSSRAICTFAFRTGRWKDFFDHKGYKMFIAKGLTLTVADKEFENAITGYLITDEHLYLVLLLVQKKAERFCDLFYEHVRECLRIHFNGQDGRKKLSALLRNADISQEEFFEELFHRLPLRDEHLVRLITGRKVKLPFQDPQADRLRREIHNYMFCSALDYEGATGPVPVKRMAASEWNAIEKQNEDKRRR